MKSRNAPEMSCVTSLISIRNTISVCSYRPTFCLPCLQAVQKVGLIGLAIGQLNKASEALVKAASNPQPKTDESEKVPIVHGNLPWILTSLCEVSSL